MRHWGRDTPRTRSPGRPTSTPAPETPRPIPAQRNMASNSSKAAPCTSPAWPEGRQHPKPNGTSCSIAWTTAAGGLVRERSEHRSAFDGRAQAGDT
jgi:hypothetical protein